MCVFILVDKTAQKELSMAMLEQTWESMKKTARDQQRELMGRGVLPVNVDELNQMVDEFCELPTPTSYSELTERSVRLDRIVEEVIKTR